MILGGTGPEHHLAQALLDALPDATAVLDTSGTITAVNKAWRMSALDSSGLPSDSGMSVNYLDVCARSAANGCADAAAAAAGLRAVLAGNSVNTELEYPCPTPDAELWFLLRITPLAGPCQGAIVSHVNITRRRAAEQELAHQAAHDPLTALANRTLFQARLATALEPTPDSTGSGHVGVLYLDLDGFKQVNDTHGHEAGDLLLQATAHRLRTRMRNDDTVARLGGDEFAVMAPHITADELSRLATRAHDALARPHHVHGHDLTVPASIGMHLAGPGDPVDDVIRHADRAMYAVKHRRAPLRTAPEATDGGLGGPLKQESWDR